MVLFGSQGFTNIRKCTDVSNVLQEMFFHQIMQILHLGNGIQ